MFGQRYSNRESVRLVRMDEKAKMKAIKKQTPKKPNETCSFPRSAPVYNYLFIITIKQC